jgi:hypothetical protein
MLPDTFETARLLLRPVAAVDVAAIFDTYSQDEEVTRYVILAAAPKPQRNPSLCGALHCDAGRRGANLYGSPEISGYECAFYRKLRFDSRHHL